MGGGVNGHTKRTRVLLSCAPCRNSKLKCDRATPCGQCLRKGKPDGCLYAPRPEKHKPAKSMAARLKRLEGSMYTYFRTTLYLFCLFSFVALELLEGAFDSKVGLPRKMGTKKGTVVREMIDTDGNVHTVPADEKILQEPSAGAFVVHGQKATNFVGGTHFMAILEDVSHIPPLLVPQYLNLRSIDRGPQKLFRGY